MSETQAGGGKTPRKMVGDQEIVAMAEIDEVLSALPGAAAVARVLDWVNARHYPDAEPTAAAAPADPNDPRR